MPGFENREVLPELRAVEMDFFPIVLPTIILSARMTESWLAE
jgi:hypothetical protein